MVRNSLMNILLITPQIPFPLVDGGKKSIFGLIKYLSKRGHKIDLVTYRKHADSSSANENLSQFCTPYILDIQTDNNIIDAIGNLFSQVPYNFSKYQCSEMENFLGNLLNRRSYDLIQVHNSHMAWVIDSIKKIRNIPSVLRQENVEMMIMRRFTENEKNIFKRTYAKIQLSKLLRYEPQICEKFDKCIMISNHDENLLKKMNPKIKACSIPSGVDFDELEINDSPKLKYSLAHIGNLNWLPNRDSLQWFLNDIFPEIVSKFPESKLFIYGGGDFQKIKYDRSLQKNIIVKGYVENIWQELSDKSLSIIPLRVGSGIRIKILEMLALGLPIITTEIGKEGIDVRDGEELLIAHSAEDFVDKIQRFFHHDSYGKQLSQRGRLFVKKYYDWNNIVNEFERVYSSIVQ